MDEGVGRSEMTQEQHPRKGGSCGRNAYPAIALGTGGATSISERDYGCRTLVTSQGAAIDFFSSAASSLRPVSDLVPHNVWEESYQRADIRDQRPVFSDQ